MKFASKSAGCASVSLIALACVCLSAGAWAQDVDYSGLEMLYGEPVTTSATGKPQTVSEAPVSMDIITAEEIQRSGALDIPQILSRYQGVDVSRSFIGFADVNMRGYNQPMSNRLLVLINGRQVYQDIIGFTQWQSFPIQLSEIKQIEIVRGPNTSLFGFNAASGVVNIVTFNPLRDDIDQVDARVGRSLYKEYSGTTTFKPNDALGIRVSAGSIDGDDFSREKLFPAGGVSSEGAIRKKSMNFDAQYKASEKTTIRAEAGFNENISDQMFSFHTNTQGEGYTRNAKFNLMHDSGSLGVWTLMAYHNSTNLKAHGLRRLLNITDLETMANRLSVVQLSNIFSPADAHTIRLGAEYRDNAAMGLEFGDSKDDQFAMHIYSANGMWDWRINDAWNWTASARLDRWVTEDDANRTVSNPRFNFANMDRSPENTEYSYNAGLTYQPTPVDSFRLSVGRGLHIPSLVELAFNHFNISAETYGNPALKAEKNFTADLGYVRKIPDQNMQVNANLVYQKIQDVIVGTVYRVGVLGDLTWENVGDSEAYSLELGAKGSLLEDNLTWNLNYTLMQIDDHAGTRPQDVLDFEGTQPRHKVNLALGYTMDDWQFDADAHYVSGMDYSGFVGLPRSRFEEGIAPSITLNARAAYSLTPQATIALEGFNLVDTHFERPAIIDNPFFGATGASEIGRAAFVSLRYKF